MTDKIKDKIFKTIGLMSGTSMDGIDVAYIETDGENHIKCGAHATFPYGDAFRNQLRKCLKPSPSTADLIEQVERELTKWHIKAVKQFCSNNEIKLKDIDLIGFHGHTIQHLPDEGRTWQIGDGQYMADQLGVTVINNFRENDMKQGGQGAPLVPVFHKALVKNRELPEPVAIVNIGGVGNITYIKGDDVVAFDTGPGNAMIDDWVSTKGDVPFDDGGKIALSGKADKDKVEAFLALPYFSRKAPKSLDRNDFSSFEMGNLYLEDGATTWSEITVQSILAAQMHLPETPVGWLITGGGRHNRYIMQRLQQSVKGYVCPVDQFDWNGDAMEAQAFGYLAARSRLRLPLSFPTTTGVHEAVTGGDTHVPKIAQQDNLLPFEQTA
jgi:anhydro-N-acetylmuramic acid kinase